MKTIARLFILICVISSVSSCEKAASVSAIPEIEFQKLTTGTSGVDDLGSTLKTASLTFSFTDGDGDLGVRYENTTDTLSRIYVIWQQKKEDGSYEDYEFENGTVVDYKIPYDDDKMNREEAQNKVLKGTIDVKLDTPRPLPVDMDTVRLEYYIMDRKLNKSNIDYTPDFSILDDNVEIEKAIK